MDEIYDQIKGTIQVLTQDKVIDNIQVKPSYKGDSIVPSKIEISTFHANIIPLLIFGDCEPID